MPREPQVSQTSLFDVSGSAATEAPDRLTATTWAKWRNPPEIGAGWRDTWTSWAKGAQAQGLASQIQAALEAGETIYPPVPWQALALTDLSAVRIVILGQDPYHGPGQAHGLAFSVQRGVAIPPSLRNIRAESQRTENLQWPDHGDLTAWAKRGVLLLNTTWTVAQAQAASHAKWGWDSLTHAILAAVWGSKAPLVCLAWGGHAHRIVDELASQNPEPRLPRLVLKANHPSPLSARRPPVPFMGCDHFSLAREWLLEQGVPWVWALD